MDRRHFFQTLLLTPFLSSLLANSRPSSHQSHICLITDNPQDLLWIILQKLEKFHFMKERDFYFSGPSPFNEPIQRSLHARGWKYLHDSMCTSVVISFQSLLLPTAPSFTLIKEGDILDIRSLGLDSLWKNMRKDSQRSSLTTIASFGKRSPFLTFGHWVSIYSDGKQLDSLSLNKNITKSYHTKTGFVTVRVKGGKASVLESSCLHKVCCSSAPASLSGEHIICAPNRFLLKIDRSSLVDTSIG